MNAEANAMKKIEAIIRPSCLNAVRAALDRRGIQGCTVSEVKGAGDENPVGGLFFRGVSYEVDFTPRLKVEIVVATPDALEVAQAIAGAARTGCVGDGFVLILPVDEAVRIRTGERGPEVVAHGPSSGSEALPVAM